MPDTPRSKRRKDRLEFGPTTVQIEMTHRPGDGRPLRAAATHGPTRALAARYLTDDEAEGAGLVAHPSRPPCEGAPRCLTR